MLDVDPELSIPGDLQLQIKSVEVENDIAIIVPTRGGIISYPLRYHPRLRDGTYQQRQHTQITKDRTMVNWPDLAVTISAVQMLKSTTPRK